MIVLSFFYFVNFFEFIVVVFILIFEVIVGFSLLNGIVFLFIVILNLFNIFLVCNFEML